MTFQHDTLTTAGNTAGADELVSPTPTRTIELTNFELHLMRRTLAREAAAYEAAASTALAFGLDGERERSTSHDLLGLRAKFDAAI